MSRLTQVLFSALLLTFLALSIALPARAFDGRSNEKTITIGANEVIEDDLYAAAEIILVEGVIKGDLIAGAQTVIINGTVEGDLIVGARDVVINGTVGDDARIFGAAFLLGENAVIGDDLVGAGGSLETRPGSKIGGDLVMGNGQNLLAGDVAGKVMLGTAAVELRGTIGGDAVFALGRMDNAREPMGPMVFGPDQTITIPSLSAGLTFGPDAKIGGKLEYISDRDLNVPASIASGGVTRSEPVYGEDELREIRRMNRTPAEILLDGVLDVIRNIASLILAGLFMAWVFPSLLGKMTANIRQKPLPSLGWGVVSWVAFFFGLLLIVCVVVVGAIAFGALTLGELSGALIWSGLASMFALIVGFVLVLAFGAKVAAALVGGQLILEKVSPQLAGHKFWPLALGVTLLAILVAIPVLGWLANFAIGLLGLGALWLAGKDWFESRRAESV
jgi:hypothetical protein